MTVRVRFAPSPTGYLHVGGARTALFNWLFARHHGGTFILRIEDTDRKRFVPDSLEDIQENLRWLGLDWDEGPGVGGPYGPYFQSERLELYRRHAEELVAKGAAYYCYCTPQRLEALRKEQMARGQKPGYDRRCRNLSAEERARLEAEGRPRVIRLKVPLEGETTFTDLIRGEITWANAELDDLVLLKSDGFPTYHLANVVDDHLMGITHVIRGDEWISSTPKHVLLYQAFGWEPPVFAHLPLILDPSGKGKMSKRKKKGPGGVEYPVLVREFRQLGYLPEALFNFLALQGWALDDHTELFTREELIRVFDLNRVKASPAAFSYDKLLWMNGVYIRKLSVAELTERVLPFLQRAGLVPDPCPPQVRAKVEQVVALEQERIKTLAELAEVADFFFREIEPPPAKLLTPKKTTPEQALTALRTALERLEALETWDEEALEGVLRPLAAELGLKTGQLFMAVRVAATGRTATPGLFETLAVLGRETTLRRLRQAIPVLEAAVRGEG